MKHSSPKFGDLISIVSASFVSNEAWQPARPVRLWVMLGCAVILCCNVLAFANRADQVSGTANPSQIELVKVLTIGDETREDDVIFGEIGGLVAVDSRGRIFVGEEQDPQIYAFTPEGDLIKSIGQRGEGPGEFSLLADIRIGLGDTLYAFDVRQRRISAFDPSSLEFTYTFAVVEDTDSRPARDLIGVIKAGFVVTYEDLPWPGTDFTTERYKYARVVSWQGQAADESIVRVPSSEYMMVRMGNRFLGAAMPYPRDPVLYLGPNEYVYSGSTEAVAISVTAANGVQRETVTHTLESIPITDSELEKWLEPLSDQTSRLIRNSDLRETKPAYAAFVVDDSGRIWVRPTQTDPEAAEAEWIVLDIQSRVVGKVVLPSSVNLQVIAAKRAYAVDEGTTGVTLAVYEIVE